MSRPAFSVFGWEILRSAQNDKGVAQNDKREERNDMMEVQHGQRKARHVLMEILNGLKMEVQNDR